MPDYFKSMSKFLAIFIFSVEAYTIDMFLLFLFE